MVDEDLCCANGTARVVSIRKIESEQPVPVYNFEVDDWHTYYLSIDSKRVLVHNKCEVEGHHFFMRAYGSRVPYGHKILTDLQGAEHVALHRALKNHLKANDLHTYGGKNARTGEFLVAKHGEQHFYNVFHDFYKNYHYNGKSYLNQFKEEVRKSIDIGLLPNVKRP
jgi:hypothetical protein